MDCREFRNKHVGFVDDTLCGDEMEAMRRHRDACASCSRHDTSVRRSLLLVRNLPCIEPSADFMVRLNDRIRAMETRTVSSRPARTISFGTFATLAAGIAVVALVGYEMSRNVDSGPMRLPPVVASTPELPPAPVASPAFAASVPTGMGVWPAVLMAGEAQLHMASLELQDGR